jgi:hypothetical protein
MLKMKPDRVHVHLTVPDADHAKVKYAADQMGMTVRQAYLLMIKVYCADMTPDAVTATLRTARADFKRTAAPAARKSEEPTRPAMAATSEV